jgi:3-phenylpropionate/cinnamic acid dioxygenase small subunit
MALAVPFLFLAKDRGDLTQRALRKRSGDRREQQEAERTMHNVGEVEVEVLRASLSDARRMTIFGELRSDRVIGRKF